VFAHIRASTGGAIQHTNCHPFRHGKWLWMHLAGVWNELPESMVGIVQAGQDDLRSSAPRRTAAQYAVSTA
jgi:predicted glutamine amidotransferase